MSTSDISANITLADYVNTDAGGKINAIGAGIAVMSLVGASTAPFSVWLSIIRRDDGVAHEHTFRLRLAHTDGSTVSISLPGQPPQPVDHSGSVQFVPRIQQGLDVPTGPTPSAVNLILSFPVGLPIDGGVAYEWIASVASEEIASAPFYVLPYAVGSDGEPMTAEAPKSPPEL